MQSPQRLLCAVQVVEGGAVALLASVAAVAAAVVDDVVRMAFAEWYELYCQCFLSWRNRDTVLDFFVLLQVD